MSMSGRVTISLGQDWKCILLSVPSNCLRKIWKTQQFILWVLHNFSVKSCYGILKGSDQNTCDFRKTNSNLNVKILTKIPIIGIQQCIKRIIILTKKGLFQESKNILLCHQRQQVILEKSYDHSNLIRSSCHSSFKT